jgi:hypothetical protein
MVSLAAIVFLVELCQNIAIGMKFEAARTWQIGFWFERIADLAAVDQVDKFAGALVLAEAFEA